MIKTVGQLVEELLKMDKSQHIRVVTRNGTIEMVQEIESLGGRVVIKPTQPLEGPDRLRPHNRDYYKTGVKPKTCKAKPYAVLPGVQHDLRSKVMTTKG